MKRLALLALLAACDGPLFDDGFLATLGPTCAPNDYLDDSACIQAQLDTACEAGGGVVHIGAGEWTLTRQPVAPGPRDNGSIWADCAAAQVTLEGAGRDLTTVMMTGSGLNADWSGLRVAGRLTLQDLTFAADKATDRVEQTHLVHLQAPVNALVPIPGFILRRAAMRMPVGADVAGDCLRFVGEAAYQVTDALVEDVVLVACDRSGLSVQRGVKGWALRRLTFVDIGKTAIDEEPSGAGPVTGLDASDLDVQDGGISLNGQSGEYTTGLRLVDSHIVGGLGLIYTADVELDRLVVEGVRADDRGTFNVMASQDVSLTRSEVRRSTGSVPGPAIRLIGHNGRFTFRVEVERNRILSETNGDVIAIESAQDVLFERNRVTYGGPTAGAYYGFFARATGQDIDAVRLANNRLAGQLAGVARLAGNQLYVRAVQLLGNVGPGVGLKCENPAKFAQPVVQGGGYLYGGAATTGCNGVTVAGQWP